ncbi:hypothetical protein [Candidatus Thiothrix anitrata]|uniref:Uncharacterized protein n=1 Tax=Candidatus Thiothrix anitrata TaxID=2823902 RepID=A0ABX7X6I8_9GAMM|nr:hypothetical protein [Candidatus Thiothrix anitrata]QTR51484.1 hypothetical protein J8380_08060 [Candidatus Thiothrix anitrata]
MKNFYYFTTASILVFISGCSVSPGEMKSTGSLILAVIVFLAIPGFAVVYILDWISRKHKEWDNVIGFHAVMWGVAIIIAVMALIAKEMGFLH